MSTLAGWQETVDTYRRLGHDHATVSVDGLGALVAELRAAREVVEAVKDWWYTHAGEDALRAEMAIGQAVKDYEKAVSNG